MTSSHLTHLGPLGLLEVERWSSCLVGHFVGCLTCVLKVVYLFVLLYVSCESIPLELYYIFSSGG